MTRTLSISNVKTHLPQLVAGVAERSEEIVVTKNGKPAAILLSYEEYENLKETLEILSQPSLRRQLMRSRKYFSRGGKGRTLEEIFAEKLRALIERLRPRDLYDVVHLHNDERWQANREDLIISLRDKCDFKQVNLPTMELLSGKSERNELESEWDKMLAHQIGDLLPFDHYWEQLPDVLNWIYKQTA